jgi:hypothetical protein
MGASSVMIAPFPINNYDMILRKAILTGDLHQALALWPLAKMLLIPMGMRPLFVSTSPLFSPGFVARVAKRKYPLGLL